MRRGALRLAVAAALATACSEPGISTAPPSGFVIVIAHAAFTPASIAVPPGATIEVVNQDADLHSVTSEATSGAYAPGEVAGVRFDTGPFSAGTRLITIPADAPDGTVVPFYCSVHLGAMAPPDGNVTVSRAAAP